ncbi:MAG TPA: D-alanyl-D-alanine carboxypeptidase family protein [Thermoanaerobaculia bacterium]
MKVLRFALIAVFVALPVLGQDEEGPAQASGAGVDMTGKGYTAAYVMEVSTGRVLHAENEHMPLPTASMAKMMTLLIAMEEIREGRLKPEEFVTVSPRASRMGGSQVYLRAGSRWPIHNMIIAVKVQSANDASTVLAEKIAGSNENFAVLMNERAKELGLTHSTFYDPHGLPNSQNPKQINTMCPHDLAILGRELMKDPFMRKLSVVAEQPFKNNTLERIYNPNHLVNPRRANYMADATGIKTGYTAAAGFCVTASAKRHDMEVIAVVTGAKTAGGPNGSFANASRLMNEALVNYRIVTSAKKGTVVGEAQVTGGQAESVSAIVSADASALMRRGEEKNVKLTFNGIPVAAPVKKGQNVGTVIVQSGNETIAKIPAVAAADVPKQQWWRALWPF